MTENKLNLVLQLYNDIKKLEQENKKSFGEYLKNHKVQKCYECEMFNIKENEEYILPEMKMFKEIHKEEKGELFCKIKDRDSELIKVTKREQEMIQNKYTKEKIEEFEKLLYKEIIEERKEPVQEIKNENIKENKKEVTFEEKNKRKEQWNKNWDEEQAVNNWGDYMTEMNGGVHYNEEWQEVNNNSNRKMVKRFRGNEFNYQEYRTEHNEYNRKENYQQNNNFERNIRCTCEYKERRIYTVCKRCDIGEKRVELLNVIKEIKFMLSDFSKKDAEERRNKIVEEWDYKKIIKLKGYLRIMK